MKVAFISRSTLFTSPGGDTKQMECTAAYLLKIGVQVDIFLAKDFIDYAQYDLLHFFNILRPADILYHVKKSGKPFVISTIMLDYGSFEKHRKGWKGFINKFFTEDNIEYLKTVARYFFNGERVRSKKYLLWGQRRSVKYLIKNAACLLPNSASEYKRLSEKYKLTAEYIIVPNAIDKLIYEHTKKLEDKYLDAVVCVARIEERKNQLNLIRAMNNTEYKIIIHGQPSPNNYGYYNRCKKAAADNIFFSKRMSEEELYILFNSARVHVLPSYFETTGLASLEAAVMGCNIVITDKGDTKEYFKDYAFYCNPDDLSSIRDAVQKAYHAPYCKNFRTYILQNYTWEKAAEKTLEAYQKVLSQL